MHAHGRTQDSRTSRTVRTAVRTFQDVSIASTSLAGEATGSRSAQYARHPQQTDIEPYKRSIAGAVASTAVDPRPNYIDIYSEPDNATSI